MGMRVEVQNIEDMRRREGIEDVELRQAIRGLRVGDLVRVTLLAGTPNATGETLLVRITSINGDAFRGKLATQPTTAGLAGLRIGLALAFSGSHIHSLPPARHAHERRHPVNALGTP